MVRTFVAQVANSQAMKLLVNDGNEFAGGFLITLSEQF
jgi:hypothetical protein